MTDPKPNAREVPVARSRDVDGRALTLFEGSPEDPRGDHAFVEARTRALLSLRRTEMEHFIAWGRLAFTLLIFTRSVALTGLTSKHVLYELGIPIAISAWVLVHHRRRSLGVWDMALVSVADAAICALLLGENIFYAHAPPYHYLGLFRMPDVSVCSLLVTLAALRFSRRAVIVSGLANTAAVLILAAVDRRAHSSALGYGGGELSLVLIVIAGSAAVGIFAAARMRSMLMDQALTLVHEERARRNLDEILRDSHDLRASLQSAMIDARLLERSYAEGAAADVASQAASIRENLENVASHLSSMRAHREAQPTPAQSRREPVGLIDALEDSIRSVRTAFSDKRIQIQVPAGVRSEGPVVLVAGGHRALRSALENLLTNACEGAHGRSAASVTVTVEIEPDEPSLRVTVADDGPGFDHETLQSLSRAERVRTSKSVGLGWGIDFVRRIVSESGGAMEFASLTPPEHGARVTMRLCRERASLD